jgi:deoxyadenosine/deoxycytidine kinase
MHIAIAGNIGAGKTTLATKLAKHYRWEIFYESVEDNPYLEDFYKDMERWAFHLQIFFLNSRINQVMQIRDSKKSVIQDRTVYEDAHIFAKNLHISGFLNHRDYENYRRLFNSFKDLVKPPDLLIYLRANVSTLVERIQKRGREYEQNIQLNYLKNLGDHYEEWIGQYKEGRLLIIDVNHLDFVQSPEDFGTIVSKVDRELFGLF